MWHSEIELDLISSFKYKDIKSIDRCVNLILKDYNTVNYMVSRFMHDYGQYLGNDPDVDKMYIYLSNWYSESERLIRIKDAYERKDSNRRI